MSQSSSGHSLNSPVPPQTAAASTHGGRGEDGTKSAVLWTGSQCAGYNRLNTHKWAAPPSRYDVFVSLSIVFSCSLSTKIYSFTLHGVCICRNMGVWTFLPAAFFGLAAGRSLWSSRPASYGDRSTDDYILKSAYPLGNGKLGGDALVPYPSCVQQCLTHWSQLCRLGPQSWRGFS